MNIILAVTFTGTPDANDVLAARHTVHKENLSLASKALPLLPFSTPAELKASYLAVLAKTVTAKHLEYSAEAKSDYGLGLRFTPVQVAVINANLVARLNAGEAAATIVTDTAA